MYEVDPTLTTPTTLLRQDILDLIGDIEELDPEEIEQIIRDYLDDHPIVIGITEHIYNRNGIPAQTWIINHNLVSAYPTVTLVVGGELVDADVTYTVGTVTVYWNAPTDGIAILREGNT